MIAASISANQDTESPQVCDGRQRLHHGPPGARGARTPPLRNCPQGHEPFVIVSFAGELNSRVSRRTTSSVLVVAHLNAGPCLARSFPPRSTAYASSAGSPSRYPARPSGSERRHVPIADPVPGMNSQAWGHSGELLCPGDVDSNETSHVARAQRVGDSDTKGSPGVHRGCIRSPGPQESQQ